MPYKDPEEQLAWQRRKHAEVVGYLRLIREANPRKDCGKKYPWYVMEWDHVPERGEKKYTISTLAHRGMTAPGLWKELAKCDIVCANCHTIRTYNRVVVTMASSGFEPRTSYQAESSILLPPA